MELPPRVFGRIESLTDKKMDHRSSSVEKRPLEKRPLEKQPQKVRGRGGGAEMRYFDGTGC
jgi:hypothetical protein